MTIEYGARIEFRGHVAIINWDGAKKYYDGKVYMYRGRKELQSFTGDTLEEASAKFFTATNQLCREEYRKLNQ